MLFVLCLVLRAKGTLFVNKGTSPISTSKARIHELLPYGYWLTFLVRCPGERKCVAGFCCEWVACPFKGSSWVLGTEWRRHECRPPFSHSLGPNRTGTFEDAQDTLGPLNYNKTPKDPGRVRREKNNKEMGYRNLPHFVGLAVSPTTYRKS